MNKQIAVYGTLRKGETNHHVLSKSLFLKTIRLKGFKMYGTNKFPTVIKGSATDEITVEIYQVVNPKILKALDFLEGFDRTNPSSLDNFYTIQELKLNEENEPIEIYTFDHNPEIVHQIGPLIQSGDWCSRKR